MAETQERDSLGPGAWQAFFGVVASPGATYSALARKPRWIGSFFVFLLFAAAASWTSLEPNLIDAQASVESTMERLGLPEAEREKALADFPAPDDRSPRVLAQYVGGGVVLYVFFAFLGAGLLHAIARFSGRSATFRMTLALYMPAFALSGLGALAKAGLMAAAGTTQVTLGPGALFPDLALRSTGGILLDLLDVFSVWNLVVLVLGAERIYGVTRGGAVGICGTYWGIKAVFSAGARLLEAWMMGGA